LGNSKFPGARKAGKLDIYENDFPGKVVERSKGKECKLLQIK